ncbi:MULTISPECIES: hypothetical protein [Bacillaceae]|uniref:Uncharacterized protein n=1 Tax=Domibacillus aminovorans TaxID=29332 RepID=A0A177KZ18_9BACI|nr:MULTISPECIES: hypothetical protein [Bacillaceae]OAH58659.1 hypothetical protein AWH48_16815 [Domibacillus aminovorans]
MKSYIVGLAMFFVLMFFITQFVANEKSHYVRSVFSNTVYQSAQQARQLGYFHPDIITALQSNVAEKLNMNVGELDLVIDPSTTTTTVKYRDVNFSESELIHYKIGIPITNIVPMAKYLGISQDSNRYVFYVEGDVSSEKLNVAASP